MMPAARPWPTSSADPAKLKDAPLAIGRAVALPAQ